MALRRPLVRILGKLRQLPAGDAVPLAEKLIEPGAVGFLSAYPVTTPDAPRDFGGLSARYLLAPSGGPPGQDHALLTLAWSSVWAAQLALDWRTNDLYVGSVANGVRSPWSRVLHSGNFNQYALPLTGGVVNGAVSAHRSGQATYATAAIESFSPDGDAVIALHSAGVSAASIRHVRGVQGVRVETEGGALAPVVASKFLGETRQTLGYASGSFTLSLGHAGAYIRYTDGTAATVTVPSEAAVPFDWGTEVTIRAVGSVTLAPAAGVTLVPPSGGTLVLSANMTVTLKKVGTDTWDVIGQTVPA